MDATWQAVGNAAGTVTVGVNRVRVEPGKLPTPPHSHGASEELYFVLAGSGLAWQDGDVHEVRPLDCVIHRPDEMEHTFVAGAEGLEYLVFGTRHPTELGWLPRSRAIRLGWPWVEGRDDDPWTSRRPASRLPSASRRHGPRTSSTSTRSSTRSTKIGSERRRSQRASARFAPACTGRSSARTTADASRTATRPRKRSSSSSRERRRSSSGRGRATSRRRR